MNILIVDDKKEYRLYIASVLNDKEKYKIYLASNGEEGLETLKKEKIDLIISDILMPRMDGYRFCSICKSDPKLSKIPFIFLTATYIEKDDESFGLQLGADEFVKKPILKSDLFKLINKYKENNSQKATSKTFTSKAEELELYSKRLINKLEKKTLELEEEVKLEKILRSKLEETEKKIKTILNSLEESIFLLEEINNNYFVVECNNRFLELFKLDQEKLFNTPVKNYLKPSFFGKLSSNIDLVLKEKQTISFEDKTKINNVEFCGKFTINPITNSSGNGSKIVCSLLDISKIKEYERDLIIKNQELELINYSLSHDLKAPLVTLSSFSNILLEDLEDGNKDAVKEDLNFITQATKTIGNLIQSMLNYSRLGRNTQEHEEITLGEIISEAKKNLIDETKNLDEIVFSYDNEYKLNCNKYQAIQLFQNLMQNSLKFRNKEVELKIEIGTLFLDEKEFIYYRDNGIGIDENFIDNAFNLYEKFDSRTEGTGMGLAIVKKIIDLHGGEIKIESEGKNKGVTFFISFG